MRTRTSGTSFSLPPVLCGTITPAAYNNWVRVKAWALFKRDRKRKLPPALNGLVALYKAEVNSAVAASGPLDPYTGDALAWDKIGTWNTTKGNNDRAIFRKEFELLPTVDHIDPEEKSPSFEICSWLINCCKSGATPAEFTGLCAKVTSYSIKRLS